MKDKDNPARLTASDIARLAEVGGKLERYARGEDEEHWGTLEIRVHVDDPPGESAEDLSADVGEFCYRGDTPAVSPRIAESFRNVFFHPDSN